MLRLVALAAAELPTHGLGHPRACARHPPGLQSRAWAALASRPQHCISGAFRGAASDADLGAFDNPGHIVQGESVVRAIEAVGSVSGRTRTAVAIAGCGELKKGAR